MTEIHDSGPITPREKKLYEQEYKHGAALFQKALQQYAKSENPDQQEQFNQVMQSAMNVLNQTAQELKRQDLIAQNAAIQADYKAYQDHPSTFVKAKLDQDLEKAKKSIH
jgi:hypothetical protein